MPSDTTRVCIFPRTVNPQVLKVPPSNPLAWQTALIDSEVDYILSGDGGDRGRKHGASAPGAARPQGQQPREFLRRGGGRTSAGGGTGVLREADGGGDTGSCSGGSGSGGHPRLEIAPGEVCPVCQEEMDEGGGEGEDDGKVVAAEGGGGLTYCRDGCGNNMHARCMLMYAEHRRSSGDKPCCPLCRVDWGITAVRALREDARQQRKGKGGGGGRSPVGRSSRRRGGRSGGCQASVAPVTCRSCSVKVQAAFFRCLVCLPAGSWDLCRRCYAMSGVRGTRSSSSGGAIAPPCTPFGRHRHSFVQGEAAADPPEWKPAEPPDGGRLGGTRGGGGGGGVGRARRTDPVAAAGLLSLQGREITTADFELLLTLDASPVSPLHEHLLGALPLCQGTGATGAECGGSPSQSPVYALPVRQQQAGSSSESLTTATPRLLLEHPPPPSRPVDRPSRDYLSPTGLLEGGVDGVEETSRSVVEYDEGGRGFEGPSSTTSGLLSSRPFGRTAVVATMLASPSSAPPPPSLSSLVAAAALRRHETAEAATGGDTEASAPAADAAAGLAATTEASPREEITASVAPAPLLPSVEVAPVSGSFMAGAASCSFCSVADTVATAGDAAARGTENGNVDPQGEVASPCISQQPHPSPSSSMLSSRARQLRRLPCGHNAHEACLVPLILESVGRGDPSSCVCPLDSCPIFPALSRRSRSRRSSSGSDGGSTPSASGDKHRRGTRSAPSSATPSPAGRTGGSAADRHARAAAARESLRRNGGGFADDALGIELVGSGLAQQPCPQPPPPPPPPHGAAVVAASATLPTGSYTRATNDNGWAAPRDDAGTHEGAEEAGKNGGGGWVVGRRVGPCRKVRASCLRGRAIRSVDSGSDSSFALFVGGAGIVTDGAGGGAAAARGGGGGAEDGLEAAASSQRSRQQSPCLVRGSTISGRRSRRCSTSTTAATKMGTATAAVASAAACTRGNRAVDILPPVIPVSLPSVSSTRGGTADRTATECIEHEAA
ncbi:unnamed protein product [Ectocarpus sp. 8 AP-2014]